MKLHFFKYDYSFLYKPVAALSVASLIVYVLKLFAIKVEAYFAAGALFLILVFIMIKIKTIRIKAVWLLIIITLAVAYFCCFDKLIGFITSALPKNVFLFSLINTGLNTFGIFDYESLMFYSSVGGARIINGNLICGIVNLVKQNALSQASVYLSAKALFVFCLCGVLLSRLHYDKQYKTEIIIIIAAIVLTGNPFPGLVLLFINDKPAYFLSLCFVFFACFAAKLLDVGLIFYVSPSVYELLLHSTARVYHIALLVFAVSVSYFLSRLVTEKLK